MSIDDKYIMMQAIGSARLGIKDILDSPEAKALYEMQETVFKQQTDEVDSRRKNGSCFSAHPFNRICRVSRKRKEAVFIRCLNELKDDPISLGEGRTKHVTPKAILVDTKEHGDVWIPKSCLHDDSEVFKAGDEGNVVVLEWWAEANDYI